MSDKLTDAQVKKLEAYKDAKDRYGYWNYLGNVVGSGCIEMQLIYWGLNV